MATADEVEVIFEADVNGYKTKVTDAATTFDRSMKQIGTSAANMDKAVGHAFNNTRISQQILQHVARSTADSLAAGTPPLMILTTHLGQLAEAGAYAGGSLGKVGAFLGGPWGIAATAAVAVLVPLIGKLFEAGDGVDELVKKLQDHYRKTQDSDRANEIFGNTIEGVTQALADNRKALEGLNLAQDTSAEKALRVAETERVKALAVRKTTEALLEQAKAQLDVIASNPESSVYGAEAQGPAILAMNNRIADIQKRLDQAKAAVTEAERQVTQGRAGVIVDQANESAEQHINRLYDKRIDDAKALAVAQNKVGDALARQVEQINRAREADLKRLKQTGGTHYSNAQAGRELSPDEAASIARGAGLQVNSVSRTHAQQQALYDAWVRAGRPKDNPVAVPGSSAHEGANGRWALDIQLGPGVTPELLRKVFAAQGVTLSKVFKERGHYHVEGNRSQADAEASAAQKAADAAQKQAEQEDKQYSTAVARLSLEKTLQQLRATGSALDAEIADQLQSNFEIESQFPQRAGETNDAYRERLKILKDIANETIRAKHADEGSLLPKNWSENVQKQLGEIGDEWERQQQDLQRREADRIQTLAGLYQDAFRGGTHAIWKDFESIGLEVIAQVLARFTASKLAGGGGGFDFGSALGTAITSVLPGFAGGGSLVIGGRGGIDRNLLSINGQPVARVSAGEMLSINNPGLMRGQGQAVIHQTFLLDARYGITTPELIHYVNQTAQGAAMQMGSAVSRGVLAQMPNRLAKYQRDGT